MALERLKFPCIFYFTSCPPEEVIYQLNFNPEGIKQKDEYVKMFEDCGREYLFDCMNYSYFRKPKSQMDGEEEIFCDDESRLEMMNRILRWRLIPLVAIFTTVFVPQLRSERKGVSIFFWILGILYLLIFLHFGSHYLRFRKQVRKG